LDVMWTDIDYMDGFRVFTLNPTKFALADMRVRAYFGSTHPKLLKHMQVLYSFVFAPLIHLPFPVSMCAHA
jgi:hypothetical protein